MEIGRDDVYKVDVVMQMDAKHRIKQGLISAGYSDRNATELAHALVEMNREYVGVVLELEEERREFRD